MTEKLHPLRTPLTFSLEEAQGLANDDTANSDSQNTESAPQISSSVWDQMDPQVHDFKRKLLFISKPDHVVFLENAEVKEEITNISRHPEWFKNEEWVELVERIYDEMKDKVAQQATAQVKRQKAAVLETQAGLSIEEKLAQARQKRIEKRIQEIDALLAQSDITPSDREKLLHLHAFFKNVGPNDKISDQEIALVALSRRDTDVSTESELPPTATGEEAGEKTNPTPYNEPVMPETPTTPATPEKEADLSFEEQLAAIRSRLRHAEPSNEGISATVSSEAPEIPAQAVEKESAHPEFRRRLLSEELVTIKTPYGEVNQPDFQTESPFETGGNEKQFIPAKEARELFKELLLSDESFPKGVTNHVLINYFDPIVTEIYRLSKLLRGAGPEDRKKLSEQRRLASNSLWLAMKSLLNDPKAFDIDTTDFAKKTADLSLPVNELRSRIQHSEDFPFHVSGRMLMPSEVKKVSAGLIDEITTPFEAEAGSRQVAGHIKTYYLDYLYRELRDAQTLNEDEKNPVTARIKRLNIVEQKLADFLRDLAAPGGVKKYGEAILNNKVSELAVDFPRLRLRPAPAIKHDPEACRQFYRDLVANYSSEYKRELAQQFKYGSAEAGLSDEAGTKQLRHLREELNMLMQEAGLSDGHIDQSWIEYFDGVMQVIATKVKEVVALREAGSRKNKAAIRALQEEVNAAYKDIGLGVNQRIVNPKVYMLTHPLQKSGDAETVAPIETDVFDESDFEFHVADPYDRDQRITAFRLFRDAHVSELEKNLGENARIGIQETTEYKAFQNSIKALRELVNKPEGSFSADDVSALPSVLDEFYATFDVLQAYIHDNFDTAIDLEVGNDEVK